MKAGIEANVNGIVFLIHIEHALTIRYYLYVSHTHNPMTLLTLAFLIIFCNPYFDCVLRGLSIILYSDNSTYTVHPFFNYCEHRKKGIAQNSDISYVSGVV